MGIPGDYCRCTGKDCERKETCERFVAWRDKVGPDFVSVSEKLCGWHGMKSFQDSYMPTAQSHNEQGQRRP